MKTKQLFLAVIIGIFCSCATAQTSKGDRQVGEFTKISTSAGIDVVFTQEGKHAVRIETDPETLEKIEVYVDKETLVLKRKNNVKFKRNASITVYVSAKNLNALSISGGADFTSSEIKNSDTFNISASGGSDVDINKLTVSECKISISGGADADIKQLRTKSLKISASGGADADINIAEADNVNASASGGADINLTGKAKQVSASASGGGDINVTSLTYENINSSKSGGGRIKK